MEIIVSVLTAIPLFFVQVPEAQKEQERVEQQKRERVEVRVDSPIRRPASGEPGRKIGE